MKNSFMKKTLAVFLCVLMLTSFCVAGVSAQDDVAVEGTCDETGHSFGYLPVEVIDATCKNPRTLVFKCKKCAETEVRYDGGIDSKAHVWIVVEEVEPTCVDKGYFAYYCTICDERVNRDVIEPTGHVDENKDGKCDVFGCGGVVANEGAEEVCTCICHGEDAIKQLIYKLLSFFWKLLKTEQICECGEIHY